MTPTEPRPEWLTRHLEATGRLNADGVSRAARTTYCRTPGCRSVIVRGLDADKAAVAVTADPEPLGPLGEFLALAAGRATYDLTWRASRYELNRRDRWRIAGNPPGPDTHVVADHVCGTRLPLTAYTPDSGVLAHHRPKETGPSDPPF